MVTVRRDPLVLMYHGIGDRSADADPHNLFVPQDTLRHQMQTLLRAGWRPLDLDAYLDGRASPKSFLVTFDDGYLSVRDAAMPVLAELGVPGVCFVPAGLLDGRSSWMPETPDERLLDADGVRDLARGGITVGGHGWDHRSMIGLDDVELKRQTAEVATVIADATGVPPRAFAYPYGDHDAAARAAVAAAGYDVGFATYDGAARMAVPRVDLNARDTARSFRMKTWAVYPAARRQLGRLPGVRSRVHRWVGFAGRDGDDRG